eukprot:CAMPEP_0203672412 /NCGR_PEP_ID=MMETSP0090-20130426/8393_1 /ASSEMBLY_ACC=CAM_ASM_001088 /TAXON_ID=426623 /ORGANISM="Chaetoceros affinis, Strain CCMP159" /LENGTH=263 /DNA_ID=CAMNT_0050537723 /DNA_START=40 /DNA_END=831 /DNA_ORIENTATION=+
MLGRNPLINLIASNEWLRAKDLVEENGNLVRKWTVAPSLSGGVHAADILPIHQACKMEDLTIHFLEALIFAYPESLRKRETGFRRIPLHIAIRSRVPDEVIFYLLEKYPDGAAVQDVLGRVPLHYAISNHSSMEVITRLIKACRSAACAVDNLGWTPLHVAANAARSSEMVEALIESAVETVVARTRKGNTPLMCANMSEGPFKDLIVEMLRDEEQKFEMTAFFQNFRQAEQNANDPSDPAYNTSRFHGVRKLRRSNSFRLVV